MGALGSEIMLGTEEGTCVRGGVCGVEVGDSAVVGGDACREQGGRKVRSM
jgi:hypothetical protein